MIEKNRKFRIVGDFIRTKREALNLSQKALGLLFAPAVTTQFISNLERGVTPLPHAHIPVLARALQTTEAELASLVEKEYALKLSSKLGGPMPTEADLQQSMLSVIVQNQDYPFMKGLYEAYQSADPQTRQAFASVCESILHLSRSTSSQ
jgi:transcriptional regulator with XRE-family HTH domain